MDKSANLERITTLVERAADAGARLAVFPEAAMCDFGTSSTNHREHHVGGCGWSDRPHLYGQECRHRPVRVTLTEMGESEGVATADLSRDRLQAVASQASGSDPAH
jgi:predicted amidohydrolase